MTMSESRLTEHPVGTDHYGVATQTPNKEQEMTTHTFTDLQDAAVAINAAHALKREVTVNGSKVFTWSGVAAKVWGTGTMSVEVKARTTRGTNLLWAKPGNIVSVEVAS